VRVRQLARVEDDRGDQIRAEPSTQCSNPTEVRTVDTSTGLDLECNDSAVVSFALPDGPRALSTIAGSSPSLRDSTEVNRRSASPVSAPSTREVFHIFRDYEKNFPHFLIAFSASHGRPQHLTSHSQPCRHGPPHFSIREDD
jgi:hypothetical protein